MLSDEVVSALAHFFDGGLGPSHDELDRLINRAGLGAVDPRREDAVVGKMKRVRAVLWFASENDVEAGARLLPALLGALRAAGSFRSGEPNFAGEAQIAALQHAMGGVGYDLSSDGTLRASSMEGLDGAALTDALKAYVRRARAAGDDAAARIGTAKDLTEATARHVLVERVGSYPQHGNFPATLWQAFATLGLQGPSQTDLDVVAGDAWEGVEKAAFLLACAINRFRNESGTGHGRPHPCLATDDQARLAAEGSALVSELLLQSLH